MIAKAAIMLTGMQIRMAMAALRWSAAKLSEKSKVGTTTIAKLTKVDGLKSNAEYGTLESVKSALSEGLKGKGMTLSDNGGINPIDD